MISRLDGVDDDAAAALRIIDYFDTLIEQRAPIGALVRAAAALAGCPAGLHLAGGLTRRFDADGRQLVGNDDHRWPRTTAPGGAGPSAWLERPGGAGPLDTLVLERLIRGVRASTTNSSDGTASASASVRIACDPHASTADRRDAVTRLGLAGSVTVLVRTSAAGVSGRYTDIGGHLVTLLPGTPVLPTDIRAGTAVAAETEELPDAHARARVALRLTDQPNGAGPSLVAYDDLGALAAVAERFTPLEAAKVNDVQRLDELLTNHPWVIDTLSAATRHTSLRQSATTLHVHHSTLQQRLASLPPRLGYVPTEPVGRQRAAVAVLLWRIAHSDDQV